MPYSNKKDVPSSLSGLSLDQSNEWARIYDACISQGRDKSSAAAIAWSVLKNKYRKVSGRWIKKESVSSSQITVFPITEGVHCYLMEYTRSQLIKKSKNDTPGRFKSRSDAGKDWSVDRVSILELIDKSTDLEVYFKVKGYKIGVQFVGFVPILRDTYNKMKNKNDKKAIKDSLTYALNKLDIKVYCSCSDFKYRFAYMATKLGYGLETTETRPAKITNPDDQGGLCKHVLKVLNSPSLWVAKTLVAINRAIQYEPGILTGNYKDGDNK